MIVWEPGERHLWWEDLPERVAAIDKIEGKRKLEDFIGHCNRAISTLTKMFVKKGERYMKATGIVRRVEECVIIGQTA